MADLTCTHPVIATLADCIDAHVHDDDTRARATFEAARFLVQETTHPLDEATSGRVADGVAGGAGHAVHSGRAPRRGMFRDGSGVG